MPQEFSISPRFISSVRKREYNFIPAHRPFTQENNKKNNIDLAVVMILSEEVPESLEEIQEILFNEFPNMVEDMNITLADIRNSVRRLFEGKFLIVQEA